jgi:hypothetical protein
MSNNRREFMKLSAATASATGIAWAATPAAAQTAGQFKGVKALAFDELPYWADPGRRQLGQINHHDDGRGVYFEDPNGHLLEIITRPYGSGGWNP